MRNRGSSDRRYRRNKSARMWRSFFLLVGSLVGCYLLIAGAVVFAFMRPETEAKPTPSVDYTVETTKTIESETKKKDEPVKRKSFKDTYFTPPKITTVLALGTDQTNLLTDVTILAFFNRETGDVDIVSIPRDLYVTLPDSLEREIKGAGKYIPNAMKITELHSYAGKDMGDYAVKEKLNYEFDISIDYTVNIDLDSFRQIVDIVGPITMEIPAGGLQYYDPDQNLRINVPGGVQQLTGKMAEGVVRYRATYPRGDLQRIEVQQEFMKLLFKQTLDKDTLISNAPQLLATIIEFVETDFKIMEGPKYLPYISKLKADKFETHTLPGEPQTLYNGDQKVSYFIHDPVEATKLFDDILNNTQSSELVAVQLYKGGCSDKRYNEIAEKLETDGYVVFHAGEYDGDVKKESTIILQQGINKSEFDKYFKTLNLSEEFNSLEDIEAVIIIGSGE